MEAVGQIAEPMLAFDMATLHSQNNTAEFVRWPRHVVMPFLILALIGKITGPRYLFASFPCTGAACSFWRDLVLESLNSWPARTFIYRVLSMP